MSNESQLGKVRNGKFGKMAIYNKENLEMLTLVIVQFEFNNFKNGESEMMNLVVWQFRISILNIQFCNNAILIKVSQTCRFF